MGTGMDVQRKASWLRRQKRVRLCFNGCHNLQFQLSDVLLRASFNAGQSRKCFCLRH